ncbi:Mitochondrial import inner membrane translocase subunit tim54 [Golovinomyces cichoracearum]|uniref:Mitochondrial import inner membrane translocase subunit TIM54 n=1 Tax=Golovinomyces cichoracearum TaxID=62708 RepID=A0A420J363_9PEZI|nr:Mitochondrial import inner membrane translocase subunit tim54 [Golovinomyces cichoracearum]
MKSQSFAKDGEIAARKDIQADAKIPNVSRKPNPIWKYMGFGENFRPRLPSRNWIIFLSIVGSFTSAVIYDKREKKRNQLKWCKLVEHISKQPLAPLAMPRKLTVYLEAPPMDGLRLAQDHFKDYVKPILVASGLDWEFVQGRKEGDIRGKVADQTRNLRFPTEVHAEKDEILCYRLKNGIKDFEGPGGDIVIGRHTWKEYIRGLHDGWLGPRIKPADVTSIQASENKETRLSDTGSDNTIEEKLGQDNTSSSSDTNIKVSEIQGKKTPTSSRFNINPLSYSTIPIPDEIPSELQPSIPISFPHLPGFLNTPRRIYRFLNRRKLADSIGRETAAVILSNYRSYHSLLEKSPQSDSLSGEIFSQSDKGENIPMETEQQTALQDEEKEWHKSVWECKDENSEKIWLSPIFIDQRIASRMRRFELSAKEEERARNFSFTEEEIEGRIKGGIRRIFRAGSTYIQRAKVDESITDRNKLS